MAAIDKELYLMEKIRKEGGSDFIEKIQSKFVESLANKVDQELMSGSITSSSTSSTTAKGKMFGSFPTVDNFKEEYQQEPLTAESIKKAKAMIENSEAMDRLQEEAMGLVPPKIPLKKRTKFRTTSISEDKNSNLFVEEELYSMASEYSLSEVDYNEYMRLKAKEKKEETERVMKPVKPTKWTKKEEVERQLIF